MQVLKQSYHKARKEYWCMAYEWINNVCDDFSMMTFSERRSIIIARNNKGMIQISQRYMYQFIVDSGDRWSFKAIPELHKICLKYDIYPND